MSRGKLQRFEDNAENTNVVEAQKDLYATIKGNWRKNYFKNENPITLELACGRGEYTVGLASLFPQKNYIGIDIKGDRIWKGSSEALKRKLNNVAFLRTYIQNIGDFFAPQEVNEIWIVFPDPRPKGREIKRRLTSPRFLEIYRNLLVPNGWIYFKTDNLPLFEYTLEVLQQEKIKNLTYTKDLYSSPLAAEHYGIITKYEKIFSEKGFKINYLKFQFA